MEDVLELDAEPYDPDRPVVCFGECRKELHAQVADPIPVAPGHPAKEDYEYVRNGTANRFVVVEPLAGTRQVSVTERRTIPDFAAQMKYLSVQRGIRGYIYAAAFCVIGLLVRSAAGGSG